MKLIAELYVFYFFISYFGNLKNVIQFDLKLIPKFDSLA